MRKYLYLVTITVFILSVASCARDDSALHSNSFVISDSSTTELSMVDESTSSESTEPILEGSMIDVQSMYEFTYDQIIASGKTTIVKYCYDQITGESLEVKTIEDEAVLVKLNEYKNSDSYTTPSLEKCLDDLNAFWVVYEDGTVVGLYEDIDYGSVDNAIKLVGNVSILPDGMSAYVKGIFEAL